MTGRFDARNGEVWDQTTVPARQLDLEDAQRLADIWREKAAECMARGDIQQARCWRDPALSIRAAITLAETQRRLNRIVGDVPTGWRPGA